MRIPSYDDLAPSIPDISPTEVCRSVAALLPPGGPAARDARLVASPVAGAAAPTRQLFAALHESRTSPLRPANSDPAFARRTQRASAGKPASPRTPDPTNPRPRDLATPEVLAAIARDVSPRIERRPGGTIVVDVTGLQRLFGEATTIAEALSRAGAPRVAVAASQTAAILLARARTGITVATGDPETALCDVPMAILEQFLSDQDGGGLAAACAKPTRRSGPARGRSFDVLGRWGLTTLGELAALPAADLSARLGPEGLALQRLARGIDPRPLVPDPGVTRFRESFELEWPIDTLEPLSFVFARLLDPLASALERADRGAIALHLDLRLTDRTRHVRTMPLPVAMRDPRVLRTLLLLDLESHPPSAAVDVVTLELDPAPARIIQYSLLERAVPSPETLATLMARLGALIGETRCGSPRLPDSHRPDGFAMGAVAFSDAVRVTSPLVRTNDINSQRPTRQDQRPQRPTPNAQRPTRVARTGGTNVAAASTPGTLGVARRRLSRQVTSDKLWRGLAEARVDSRARRRGSWELGVVDAPRPMLSGATFAAPGATEISGSPAFTVRRFRPPVAIRVVVEAGRPVHVAIDRRGMPGGDVRQAAGPWRTSGGWWVPERWDRDEWEVAFSDGAVCRVFRDRDQGQWFLDGVFD